MTFQSIKSKPVYTLHTRRTTNTIGVTHSYGRKGKGGDGHVGMNFGRGTRIKDDARKQQSLVSSLKYFSDFDKLRLRREVTIELGIASTGPK